MGRILVSVSHYDTLCLEAKEFLSSKGHQVVFDPSRPFPAYSKEELKLLLPGVDAAIIGMDVYDEEVFSAAPDLKAVAKFGVGVDNIDSDAAARHGVYVINAPGQNSNSVAELALGMIIDLLRGITPLDGAVKQGRWPRVMGRGIGGQSVGLVGFGAIAQCLAAKLSALGASVSAYDVAPDRKAAASIGVRLCTLDEVLTQSDIISLHVPAVPATYHMIGRAAIGKMKRGVYLVNTARGPLVDTGALAEALNSGKIAAAALDAFEQEPLPADAPILQCRNLIATPHIGGETCEAYHRLSLSTARDVDAVLSGRDPVFCVNRDRLPRLRPRGDG